MEIGKFFANRGVERNKRPLKNIVYEIELSQLEALCEIEKLEYQKYKFRNLGYLGLYWWYEEKDPCRCFHGFVTPESLRKRIGEKQWNKFCQGKRTFVIQRRINGRNIPKEK